MIIDLPATDCSAVNAALVDIREAGGAITLGRVLTLVVVTDETGTEDAIGAANEASREHPCRIIVLARGTKRSQSRLDAQVRVGGDAGASEVVVLRLYGQLADHGDSVVVPLLLPDAPIVAWWPGAAPAQLAADSIGKLAQRRITDAARTARPAQALAARRADYTAGDTDFTWTRLTSWRALLAAALDQPPYERVRRAVVVGSPTSASSDLLAGWLADCLDCPVTRNRSPNAGVSEVRLERASGTIVISRPQGKIATLTQPDQPDRQIALPRRTPAECLAEELRRLDADEVYAETLITGMRKVKAGGAVRATGPGRTRRSRGEHPHDLGPGVFPAPATSAAGQTLSSAQAPDRATADEVATEAERAPAKRQSAREQSAGTKSAPAKRTATKGTPTKSTPTKAAAKTGAATGGAATKSAATKRAATTRGRA